MESRKTILKAGGVLRGQSKYHPYFSKCTGSQNFMIFFCEHALFIFYVKIITKKNGRFGIGFSMKYDIFEVPIKHPLHGWFEVELLIDLMIFVNSLIYKNFTKK